MRLFRSVWGQFFIIGLGLFLLDRTFFPEPKPVIGPPNAERVALQADALSQLQGAQLNESQVVAIKSEKYATSYCSLRHWTAVLLNRTKWFSAV